MLKFDHETRDMAQWVKKSLTAEPDNLSSIYIVHMMEGVNRLPKVVL